VVGIAAYFSTPDGLRRCRNGDAPLAGTGKALETAAAPGCGVAGYGGAPRFGRELSVPRRTDGRTKISS